MLKYSYVQQLRKEAGFGQNVVDTLSTVSPAFGIAYKGVRNVAGTVKGVYNGAKNLYNGIKGGIQGFRAGFSGTPQANQPAVQPPNQQPAAQPQQQQSMFNPAYAMTGLCLLGSLPSMFRKNTATPREGFNAGDYIRGLYMRN